MTSIRTELWMKRIASLALTATLAFLSVAHTAHAVTIRAGNANVSGAGQTATICVNVETQGEPVAGTQNELVWDTTCATLSGLGSCRASSGHGKDLHASFPNGDGLPPLRAFVFSMKNVGVMSDGELYCCDFTAELISPGSCSIAVQGARASDPQGRALSATGGAGSIVLGGGGGGGGSGGVVSGGVTGGAARGGGASGGGASGGAVGGGAVGGGGAVAGGGEAAGGGAGPAGGVATGLGQSPSQVLPGGVPAEEPLDTDTLAREAQEAARAEAERIINAQRQADVPEGEAEVIEPEPEPTEEPTPPAAPTSPAPQATTPARGTPTAKAPTAGRTPAAAPAAAAAEKKEESSSWFGCQVTTGGDVGGAVFLLIGLAGVLVNRIRRFNIR
jgi:hypothetical protein